MFRKAHDFSIDQNTQINAKNYYAVNIVQEPEPQAKEEESLTDFLLGEAELQFKIGCASN
jgi:hypothetical protein